MNHNQVRFSSDIKRLELLAPAKNVEAGMAAISCGADAVYIGAPRFGARQAAGNSVKDIELLCNYAHLYNAKVYVAFNTLLFDSEITEAVQLCYDLHASGIDALIIQDMALMEAILPPIPIHASTQTDNLALEKILFLEKSGFSRVILGRELSLSEMIKIRENTQVELEAFIHGALCVSHSGQCYLSHSSSGRSANRGECAQPCRLPYTLEDAEGKLIAENKHLLSLKDLNLSAEILELIKAGITSFKIEGRLKDLAYVKNVTSHYRKKIDEAILQLDGYQKASSGTVHFNFIPDLEKTFNRGYTDYFFHDRSKDITAFDSPKSTGKPVAHVETVRNQYFTISALEPIHNNDGLCYFDKRGNLQGIKVNRVEGEKVFPLTVPDLEKGQLLYRNHDHEFTQQLESITPNRKIEITILLTEESNSYKLKIVDVEGISVSLSFEKQYDEARDSSKALQTIKDQLDKFGQTIYHPTNISINLKAIPFIPISKLNELRRDIADLLTQNRLSHYKEYQQKQHLAADNNRHSLEALSTPFPAKQIAFNGNVVNKLAAKFYERHGVELIEDGFELIDDFTNKQLMATHHCLKYSFGLCPNKQQANQNQEFKSPLFLVTSKRRYRLAFDCKNCIMKLIY
ncbi:MAG: U32 family peptidase [Bacteroidetes bacterium]|nr:U32 family peptidase [Bacteroidota bacterium]